jgi:hypothetical protein
MTKKRDMVTIAFALQLVALAAALWATAVYWAPDIRDFTSSKKYFDKADAVALRERLSDVEVMTEKSAKNYDELLKSMADAKLDPTIDRSGPTSLQLASVRQATALLSSELAGVRAEVAALSRALGSDPERALSVPLIRKDVEDLRKETERENDLLRAEMARSNELDKWLIGLIIAALLATVANTVLSPRFGRSERSGLARFE